MKSLLACSYLYSIFLTFRELKPYVYIWFVFTFYNFNFFVCLKDECRAEGEYYDTTLSKCQHCPNGTYKEASGFIPDKCTPCPTGTTTMKTGSIRRSDCQGKFV